MLKCGAEVVEADSWSVALLSFTDSYLFSDPSCCPGAVCYLADAPATPETSPAGGSFLVDSPSDPNTTFTITDQTPFLAFTGGSGYFGAIVRVTAVYKGIPFYVDVPVVFGVEAAL